MWALVLGLATTGSTQAPDIPPEFLRDMRRLQGNRLTFCVDVNGPTASFDRAVAEAIGRTLLVETVIEDVDKPQRVPFTREELFILLTDYCDAFMGIVLASGGYPDWMTITREYYFAAYVLAVTDDSIRDIEHIPRNRPIGTRSLSLGDVQLVVSMRNMPEDRRWRRFPYPDDTYLVERLLDGTLAGALVWEPALVALAGEMLASREITLASTSSISNLEWGVGIALRSREAPLRTMLDGAISALVASGEVEALMATHSVPGRAGQQ